MWWIFAKEITWGSNWKTKAIYICILLKGKMKNLEPQNKKSKIKVYIYIHCGDKLCKIWMQKHVFWKRILEVKIMFGW